MRIELPSAKIVNAAAVTAYPFSDSASDIFIVGEGAISSCKNRALGGLDATAHGAIAYEDNYAIFSGDSQTNYLQTQIVDSAVPGLDADLTIITVARMPNAALGVPEPGRGLLSNYNGAGSSGNYGFSVHNVGAFQARDGGADAAYFSEDVRFQQPVFYFRAATVTSTAMTAYQRSGGKIVDYSQTAVTRALDGDSPWRIGGDYYAGGYDDTAHIAFVARHRGAFTREMMRTTYEYLRSYYAARGERVL
ncbi:hypothetical protein [Sphingobium sp. DC-2]|uniref:hypothetical protein n=1 Tax=Sphingobium sp. DC-2 TaxID=1303256 RepID=UPI0004C46AD5|nr:hypothetical protein [Sphingobium sp. DC-2]